MQYKKINQKAITVRFPIDDFLAIQEEAEQANSNLAEVLRKCWKSFREQNNNKQEFKKLEAKILKNTFDICCAVQGLTQSEKKEALQELKNLKKEKKEKNYE